MPSARAKVKCFVVVLALGPLIPCLLAAPETTTQDFLPTDDRDSGTTAIYSDVEAGLDVTNGQPVKEGEYPWVVALGYRTNTYSNTFVLIQWICGGSLITVRHVLTAAHCNNLKDDRNVYHRIEYARVGILHTDPKKTNGDSLIKNVISSQDFDIAIVELRTDVKFTRNVAPISLLSSERLHDKLFENKCAFVAGWGQTESNKWSRHLRKVSLPVFPRCVCTGQKKCPTPKDHIICAGGEEARDACYGDSGGPLMMKIRCQGQFVLIGVVSNGIGCGEENTPGVYTNTSHFVPWIREEIKPYFLHIVTLPK